MASVPMKATRTTSSHSPATRDASAHSGRDARDANADDANVTTTKAKAKATVRDSGGIRTIARRGRRAKRNEARERRER